MLFNYKCHSGQIIISLLMITISCVTKNTEAARDRGARCEKPDYIPNGSYRVRRDRVMRITCNSGFVLQGPKTIECIRGKWDGEKPVCAKKGCKKDLTQPENGRIQIENDVKAILYCSDNYNLAGNRHSYCNGSHWDRPIGNCRVNKNVIQHQCDFETDDICGWTYEPKEGLEWKRVMAANVFTSFKTGPRHDHTTLTANGGHYMLMESLTRQNDDVTLTSPIYDVNMSLKTACCFQFYYFMYGAGVGDLTVVVKPVSLDLDDLLKNHKDLIKFQKHGNQNNIWNEAHFNIEEFQEDFQIVFVAKSGRGQLSDIAVDDVKLLSGEDCRVLDSKDEEYLSNEEFDTTTYESIFEMQSCLGHCFESPGSGLVRTYSHHLKGLCNCDIDCEDNETCCPDFRTVCLNELFSQSTHFSETDEAYKSYSTIMLPTTASTTRKPTPKSTSKTTTPTTIITTASTMRTKLPTKTTPTNKTTLRTTKPTPTTTKTIPTTTKTTRTTAKTTLTTARIIPTTTKSTTTTTKTTPTTTKTTPTTTKTTPTTTFSTTTILTTPKPIILKTTKITTTRLITPAIVTQRTGPVLRKITLLTTPKTTSISPTTTTTRKTTTPTTSTTQITSTTTKKIKASSTRFPTTTTGSSTESTRGSTGRVTRKPIPASKTIEYVMNDSSKTEAGNKGNSKLLVYTFFIIVGLLLACAAYKRFGDKAIACYMIHFTQSMTGDEDSSARSSSSKQTQATSSGTNGSSKVTWRSKVKKPTQTKNIMKTLLLNEDDEDDDDDVAANGNIALKNNIYTEL